MPSWTAGAARSTSQVVNRTFAPPPISLSAQAFETAGLSPCVSQVLITSGCPFTPPFALICLTRICAAASAGPSNGAIGPVESCAQPMTIGVPAAAESVCAAAVAANVHAATATITNAIRAPGFQPGFGGFAAEASSSLLLDIASPLMP
jgi:hypothetical protein